MFQGDWFKRTATKAAMLEDRTAYRTSRNLVNKEIRLAKNRFYQSRINEASGDQKATWQVLLVRKPWGHTLHLLPCNIFDGFLTSALSLTTIRVTS